MNNELIDGILHKPLIDRLRVVIYALAGNIQAYIQESEEILKNGDSTEYARMHGIIIGLANAKCMIEAIIRLEEAREKCQEKESDTSE